MPVVIDASITMAWLLPDETDPLAEKVLQTLAANGQALVPSIWWFEVCNSLIMNERRGRLDQATANETLSHLQKLPILECALDSKTATVDLARRNRLTAYDAAYLGLAQEQGCALATLDKDLRAACKAESIQLFA
jgi:predicted nucleic acid-binding protein